MTDQPSKDDNTMAVLCYVLAIFTGFVGPLIIWLIKKDQSPFVNEQGKEVLNWEITTFLAMIVCFVLAFVVVGIFLMPLVALANLIFLIIGAVKVGQGQPYRFPFALRLLR